MPSTGSSIALPTHDTRWYNGRQVTQINHCGVTEHMGNESHTSDAFAIDEVRELLQLVKENEIHELTIERGESRLRIKRGHAPVAPVMMHLIRLRQELRVHQPSTSPSSAVIPSLHRWSAPIMQRLPPRTHRLSTKATPSSRVTACVSSKP